MKKTMNDVTIADIPWKQLSTPYGLGDEIPDLIREKRYEKLSELIEHQSTLWQVTPWTILMLLKELEQAETAELSLLECFAVVLESCQLYNIHEMNQQSIVPDAMELLNRKYLYNPSDDLEMEWEEDEPNGYDTVAFSSYYWYSFLFISEYRELFLEEKEQTVDDRKLDCLNFILESIDI